MEIFRKKLFTRRERIAKAQEVWRMGNLQANFERRYLDMAGFPARG